MSCVAWFFLAERDLFQDAAPVLFMSDASQEGFAVHVLVAAHSGVCDLVRAPEQIRSRPSPFVDASPGQLR